MTKSAHGQKGIGEGLGAQPKACIGLTRLAWGDCRPLDDLAVRRGSRALRASLRASMGAGPTSREDKCNPNAGEEDVPAGAAHEGLWQAKRRWSSPNKAKDDMGDPSEEA